MSRPLPTSPRRIILIKSHSAGIGDILRSSAAWAVLKNRWPEAELHLLFLTRWPGYPSEALIREHHLLSSAHFLPMTEGRFLGMRGVGPASWRRLLPQVGAITARIWPDLIIDHEPHGLESTIVAGWVKRRSGAPTVGVAEVPGRGLLYDHAAPGLRRYAARQGLDWPMDYTERDFAALAALGLARNGQAIRLQETAGGRALRQELAHQWPGELPVVGLNIGCGTADAAAKRPDLASLAQWLGRLAQSHPHRLLLTGAPFETSVNAAFMDSYRRLWGNGTDILDLAGKTTLSTLTGAIAGCRLFISSDSGPYHMAVAMGMPTLALFNFPNSVHYHHHPWTRILVAGSAEAAYDAAVSFLSIPSSGDAS
jgi:hypothetical protein